MSKRPHSQNHCDTLKNTHTEMQTLSPTVCDQPPLTARCSLPIFVRECTSEYPQWPDMVLGGMAGVSSKLWAPSASRQASQDVRGARRFEGSGAGEAPAQGCLLRTDDSGTRPSGEWPAGWSLLPRGRSSGPEGETTPASPSAPAATLGKVNGEF